jgi:ethanolamine ammonia-lyase small subunit
VNRDEIRKVVEEELRRAMEREPAPRRKRPAIARWLTDHERSEKTQSASADFAERAGDFNPRRGGDAPGREPLIEKPANPAALERFMRATPSRIGVGRAGMRYLTGIYVGLRADHAVAKDAVYSETKDGFPESLGCLPLRSQCRDRQEFLLHPGRGRRLDDASQAALAQGGTKGAQVQVIVGDGLSAWAAAANAPELLPCLAKELGSAGFSLGRPLYVRFARVGVQDHVGVLLGCKATLICLGERPGLGTGDSLSIYLAYGPKLDQDNAEKNCISNVRPLGIRPPEAARQAAAILKRAFAAGRGGVSAP